MSKLIASIVFVALMLNVYAQVNKHSYHKTEKHRQGAAKRIGIFINPLSPLEPQEAAAGAGCNLMLFRRWDMSLELNYLFDGFSDKEYYHDTKGYRAILSIKRFSKSRVFFYGIEGRIKYFSFTDKRDFANELTGDTLYNFRHNATNTLYGFAGIVGVRLPISKNKKWALEIQTGFGNKYRYVVRKNIPAGYNYLGNEFPTHYNFTPNQDISSDDNVYFPSGIRVMYFF